MKMYLRVLKIVLCVVVGCECSGQIRINNETSDTSALSSTSPETDKCREACQQKVHVHLLANYFHHLRAEKREGERKKKWPERWNEEKRETHAERF